jgi:hypothetical protein
VRPFPFFVSPSAYPATCNISYHYSVIVHESTVSRQMHPLNSHPLVLSLATYPPIRK